MSDRIEHPTQADSPPQSRKPFERLCQSPPLSPAAEKVIAGDGDIAAIYFRTCGRLSIPDLMEGCTVLILGHADASCAHAVSQLVGLTGRTIVAERDLQGIADGSVDVVLTGCMFNAAADRSCLLTEVFRVLVPGGEFRLSAVFADRRLDANTAMTLKNVCPHLANAPYLEDFRRLLLQAGVRDYRVVAAAAVDLDAAAQLRGIPVDAAFAYSTVCAFNLPDAIEDICEQYGQTATYLGTIPGHPRYFDLDGSHRFFVGRPEAVCGNTAAMIQDTRYAQYFEVSGDRIVHQGRFIGC